MSSATDIIHVNEGTLSFGNYKVTEKQKAEDFKWDGNTYSVKSHDQVTRIEKNGTLLLETVPGTTIHNFSKNEEEVAFSIKGYDNTNVIVQLEGDTLYRISDSKNNLGNVKSNLSGKINFAVELTDEKEHHITIKKI